VTTEVALLVVTIVAVALAVRLWTLRAQLNPRRGRRSAKQVPVAEVHDEIAGLMLDVLALRDQAAQWSAVLARLNPEEQPKLRTVLLELRWLYRDHPDAALRLIERVCIATRKSGSAASRLELLEMSKSLADRSHLPTHGRESSAGRRMSDRADP
jgi:hypothetical protein